MSSGKRLLLVGFAGGLVLIVVVGSIVLSQSGVFTPSRDREPTWSLPTPTLYPTEAPPDVVIPKPTAVPTESEPTITPESTEEETEAPTGTPSRVCETPAGWIAYVVREGDTWERLAEVSGTNVQELLQGNCLRSAPDLTDVSLLYLPSVASATAAPPKATAVRPAAPPPTTRQCKTPPASWVRVTVVPGETLWALARRYGTTPQTLITYNCLSSERIQAGSVLRVPPTLVHPPTPRPTYTAWPTVTPAVTATPAVSPTPAQTSTPTAVPTDTPVPPPTPIPTETPVLVPTWTPVVWPTATSPVQPTPTPLPTNTPPATPTPLPTPTSSPLPPPTPTWTPPAPTPTSPPGNG